MNKYKECWKWPWNNHVALAKPVRNLCVHAFEVLSTSAKGHLFALHWNKASLESISSKGWGDWKDVLGFGIMQSWESQIAKLYSLLTPTGIMEACHRIILKKNYEMRKTDWFILYLIDRVWYRISWCVQSEKGKPSQVLSPAVDSVRLPEHVFFLVRSPEQGAGSLPQLHPGTLPMLCSTLSRWSCASVDFLSFVWSIILQIHNICITKSSEDEFCTDDQTIILGYIFLDHRSSRTIEHLYSS